MGALKINCHCSETQMKDIISLITKHIANADRSEISDIDEVMGDIRLCVEFETCMNKVSVVASEILDSDWDILPEDTAVLTSYLKPIMKYYNQHEREAYLQAVAVLNDQLAHCE